MGCCFTVGSPEHPASDCRTPEDAYGTPRILLARCPLVPPPHPTFPCSTVSSPISPRPKRSYSEPDLSFLRGGDRLLWPEVELPVTRRRRTFDGSLDVYEYTRRKSRLPSHCGDGNEVLHVTTLVGSQQRLDPGHRQMSLSSVSASSPRSAACHTRTSSSRLSTARSESSMRSGCSSSLSHISSFRPLQELCSAAMRRASLEGIQLTGPRLSRLQSGLTNGSDAKSRHSLRQMQGSRRVSIAPSLASGDSRRTPVRAISPLTGGLNGPFTWFPMFRLVIEANVRTAADEQLRQVNDYVVLQKLGAGRYGEVYLVQHAASFVHYALKQVYKEPGKRPGQMQRGEVDILIKLRHCNVVRLFEVIDDPSREVTFMVFEHVDGGPVMHVRDDGTVKRNIIKARRLRSYVEQILNGLQYLHDLNIVHYDIKPDNVLVSRRGAIKIADLGVSRMLHSRDDMARGTCGTPMFLSPEACREGVFSGKCNDVWALGVTMYIMVYSASPFGSGVKTRMEVFQRILQREIQYPLLPTAAEHDAEAAPMLVKLLQRLLDRNPLRRITLSEALANPWVRGSQAALPEGEMREALELATSAGAHFASAGAEPSGCLGDSCAKGFTQASSRQSVSVLIVEDVFAMQQVLRRAIRSALHPEVALSIQSAGNGLEAVEACSKSRYDIVIMNVYMSRCSGILATGRIRKHEADNALLPTNIIGLVSEYHDQVKTLCHQVGMHLVLLKPVAALQLRDIFARVGVNVGDIAAGMSEQSPEDRTGGALERNYDSFVRRPRPAAPPGEGAHYTPRVSLPDPISSPGGGVGGDVSASGSSSSSATAALLMQGTTVLQADEPAQPDTAPAGATFGSIGLGYIERSEEMACIGALLSRYYTAIGWPRAQQLGAAGHAAFRQHVRSSLPGVLKRVKALPENQGKVPLTQVYDTMEAEPWWREALMVQSQLVGMPFEVYVHAEQGRRSHMEDHAAIVLYPTAVFSSADPGRSVADVLACVFDGHGGAEAAAYCSRSLPAAVALHPSFATDPGKAFEDSFMSVNADFLRKSAGTAGTTACMALLRGGVLTVANAGDCRAVLGRRQGALQLTRPHLASDEREMKLVTDRGGEVEFNAGKWRVDGCLAVTRALGNHSHCKHITSVPELHTHTVTPDDEFLIVASDGLWDALDSEAAVAIVQQLVAEITQTSLPPREISAERRHLSEAGGSPRSAPSSGSSLGHTPKLRGISGRLATKTPSSHDHSHGVHSSPAAADRRKSTSLFIDRALSVTTETDLDINISMIPEILISEAMERGATDNVACIILFFRGAPCPTTPVHTTPQ